MMADLIDSGLMDELVGTHILKHDDDEPQGTKRKTAELLKMLLG